jgi:DNA mismatch repair ATPase MutS
LPKVQNCHVTARKGNQGLTFLYEVRPGPCLESFGIQVAEMANVPACVIEDAKRKAEQLENFGTSKRSKTQDDNNVNFVERFRQLDLPFLLKESGSMEEKQARLLELMA